jgi:hypothetical protein
VSGLAGPRHPAEPRLRHTYIVLVHTAPDQVERLLDRLDGDGVDFVLHVDRRSPARIASEIARLGARRNVTVLPSRPTPWASVGIVLATLDGLSVARERGSDYVSLLSGQDYPIKSPQAIRRRLLDSGGRSFLEHFPMPRLPGRQHGGVIDERGWEGGGMSRLHSWSFTVAGGEFRVPNNRLHLPVKRRTPAGLRFFGGSQWWTLSAAAVDHVGRVVEERPHVVRFFRRVAAPDEIFFHTLLADGASGVPLINDSLRYIDWRTGGSHPKILTEDDLPALAQTDALFARKFNGGSDSAVFDLIDRRLLCA